ncbi:uncharacterized protein EI90DRAFT_3289886 [Cantharellus anzutake]|uniref:uncharacterized protein n=1 Tax=Cantharellus anzutake TaxID=1750568 RepID=UPI0019037D57|nr:uncharacterized protein EI90DRAFT_3289886 [Cantharellus anzutake]KAF8330162.1 hypothetical protein EI90DRAFT_3289886 [Cantharellus anzutake]
MKAHKEKRQTKKQKKQKRDQYREANITPVWFIVNPELESQRAHKECLKGIDDSRIRHIVEVAESKVDINICNAMTNTIKLDFDYADIASHNDGAVPPAKSQLHPKDLELPPLSSNHARTLLESEAGAAIEDRSGNLLAIRIPNVFSPIHEEILNAGREFNRNFKFDKKKSRNHFVPSLDLFQKGQVHYGYWHQQGHYEISPQISTDSKEKEHNHPFQKKCEPLYHILNMYTERIAPSLAKQSDQVWEQIRKHRDHEGFLSEIKSHFFGQTVHFNADIRRHKDRRSAWCGFDAIAVFGEYEGGNLHFRELGCSFPSHPRDLFFIRGAGLDHEARSGDQEAGGWVGKGRMVFAFFSDRRVFAHEHIPRPKDLGAIYGTQGQKKFREHHPHLDR